MAANVGGVRLGEGPVKVIVPLTGASASELVAQASDATRPGVDILEWRVDLFAAYTDPDQCAHTLGLIADATTLPILATFRTDAEGGAPILPDAYLALYRALIATGRLAAVDVELAFDTAAGDAVADLAQDAGASVIGSFHDFERTPSASEMVSRLTHAAERGFDVGKIAVMPSSPDDVLSVLAATRAATQLRPGLPVIVIAMGRLGVITRLAGGVFGSCATFASVGDASAPGQIGIDEMRRVLDLLAH